MPAPETKTRRMPKANLPHLTAASVPDVAKALGVTTTTIRNWIQDKTIHGVKLGGEYRIPISEVERIIREVEGPVPER